jgi:hypothetical protein
MIVEILILILIGVNIILTLCDMAMRPKLIRELLDDIAGMESRLKHKIDGFLEVFRRNPNNK